MYGSSTLNISQTRVLQEPFANCQSTVLSAREARGAGGVMLDRYASERFHKRRGERISGVDPADVPL